MPVILLCLYVWPWQLHEFCELSKATGFDPIRMRGKFRYRDIGDRGELSMEVMEDLLDELRDEAMKAAAEGRGPTEQEAIALKAAQQASPLGKLVAQAGII
jgi:hypothetical protein